MHFLNPIAIGQEILTSPLAVACYILLALFVGFVAGKWSGQYG